jgi:hypothetical protein
MVELFEATLTQPLPCTPAIRLDVRLHSCYMLLLCIILVMWCFIEDCMWVAKALGANNMVITWEDLAVYFGCVVRVESTRHGSMTSLWAKSCRKGVTWASFMRGTCGGYRIVEQIPGRRLFVGQIPEIEVLSKHGVLVIPLRRCLVWSL